MDGTIDVVTGGAGFIGSHVVDRLLGAGRNVRVLDSFVTGRPSNLAHHGGNPQLEVVQADVTDAAAATRVCEGAERVFHLAARADIVPSIVDPEAYFQSNVAGTFAIVDAARQQGVRRFIYAASSSCYGITGVYPTPEDAPIDCRHPYALTKHLGERLVQHWAQVYDLPAVSLRLFNVYGPRARSSGAYGAVFGVFLAQLLAGRPLTIVGDGRQKRDFTFVSDVVDALLLAADKAPVGEVYNVGSGNPVSITELVRLLGSPPTVNLPTRPGEPECTWADTSRIRTGLGWEPSVDFAHGVRVMREQIDYWRDAPVWSAEAIGEATSDWFRHLGRNRDLPA